jgi:hypothetical protein
LLLGLGLIIGKQLAWILIAVALTALVLLAIGGAYVAQPSPEPETMTSTITAGEATTGIIRLGPQPPLGKRDAARIAEELARSLAAVRGPSAQLQDWLEHEQERGSDFLQSIKVERVALLQAVSMPGAIAHFGVGMRITTLAKNISSWNGQLADRVTKELSAESAAPFYGGFRPIQGQPTGGDLDRLESYVRERQQAIRELLA